MASISDTAFIADSSSFKCVEHYLKIEDTAGNELFLESFKTKEALEKRFNEIKASKKGYSLVLSAAFPVRTGTLTQFFQSFFIPQTMVICSALENLIAKIAASFFAFAFDMMTLPLRAVTIFPYVVYNKVFHSEEDHKVIELIRDKPFAANAISEGKVFLKAITENFSNIQSGSVEGIRGFKIEGTIFSEVTDVCIQRPLYLANEHSSKSSYGYKGFFNESIRTRYRAFRQL